MSHTSKAIEVEIVMADDGQWDIRALHVFMIAGVPFPKGTSFGDFEEKENAYARCAQLGLLIKKVEL